jgi:hypothetical protein
MREGLYRKSEGRKLRFESRFEPPSLHFCPFPFSILREKVDGFLLIYLHLIISTKRTIMSGESAWQKKRAVSL